jgi:hypothetical protein
VVVRHTRPVRTAVAQPAVTATPARVPAPAVAVRAANRRKPFRVTT